MAKLLENSAEIVVTLSVYARKMMPDGTLVDLEPTSPHNELAGFESKRQGFYGSESVRKLGLTLLPTLAHENIQASGNDLDLLEREVQLLLAEFDFTEEREYWVFRLENILEAIRLAKEVSDGIGIVYIE